MKVYTVGCVGTPSTKTTTFEDSYFGLYAHEKVESSSDVHIVAINMIAVNEVNPEHWHTLIWLPQGTTGVTTGVTAAPAQPSDHCTYIADYSGPLPADISFGADTPIVQLFDKVFRDVDAKNKIGSKHLVALYDGSKVTGVNCAPAYYVSPSISSAVIHVQHQMPDDLLRNLMKDGIPCLKDVTLTEIRGYRTTSQDLPAVANARAHAALGQKIIRSTFSVNAFRMASPRCQLPAHKLADQVRKNIIAALTAEMGGTTVSRPEMAKLELIFKLLNIK